MNVPGVAPGWSEVSWVDDGAFLRQLTDRDAVPDSDPWRGLAPFPTVCVIGLDDSADEFTMLYTDARGAQVFVIITIGTADVFFNGTATVASSSHGLVTAWSLAMIVESGW